MGNNMILTDFFKAVLQLPDPRFRRVLMLGIGLTIALLVGIYALILALIQGATSGPMTMPDGNEVTWIGDLLGAGSFFLMIVMSVFLMIPVASAITSLFLDDVAQAVEDVHYPHLAPMPRVSFWEGLRDTLNFLGILLLANILAMVLYVFLPFAAIPIFYALNGYLLGREYFQLVAMRRVGRTKAKELWSQNSGAVWRAGCLMAIPLSIPLVNLIVPILGAATFTHLFHRVCPVGSAVPSVPPNQDHER